MRMNVNIKDKFSRFADEMNGIMQIVDILNYIKFSRGISVDRELVILYPSPKYYPEWRIEMKLTRREQMIYRYSNYNQKVEIIKEKGRHFNYPKASGYNLGIGLPIIKWGGDNMDNEEELGGLLVEDDDGNITHNPELEDN